MIRPGRLWWLLRRDAKRGFRAAWHHYLTLPRIIRWRPPAGLAPAGEVPVFALTRGEDWLLAAWMLASWFEATGREWRVVVLEDGTLPETAKAALAEMFPSAEIVGRAAADRLAGTELAGFPLLAAYRREHPLGLKLADAAALAAGKRYLILDSDLLFFRRPDEFLERVAGPEGACWFNRDVAEGSLVTAEEAASALGVRLWERVNSGLCLIGAGAVDFAFCERALRETAILRGHPWRVEQTLFALCASRRGEGGLLGPEYEVSLGKWAAPGAVCRHYVGAVRDRFYAEGVARLRRRLLG